MNKIGENIRFYRTQKSLKQADLGKMLGKAPSVIANWEAGTNLPNAPSIEKMCVIFEIDANTLFGWSEGGSLSANLSNEAVTFAYAYDRSPENVRRGIRAMLEPYMVETSAELVPDIAVLQRELAEVETEPEFSGEGNRKEILREHLRNEKKVVGA